MYNNPQKYHSNGTLVLFQLTPILPKIMSISELFTWRIDQGVTTIIKARERAENGGGEVTWMIC